MLRIGHVNIATKKNWNPKSQWAICKLKKEKYVEVIAALKVPIFDS